MAGALPALMPARADRFAPAVPATSALALRLFFFASALVVVSE
ncbi:hypothetical protein [Halodurantibacterium flavum]|uniref:EamA family transporter n=1 Tax=Halodurantibacterium flavum TaxID=1382802 RepID=A0ABW4S3Q1_9RHOB